MTFTFEDIKRLPITGVSEFQATEIRSLLRVWQDRVSKNKRRSLYFDAEQGFKDLGITLPPQMRNLGYVLSWATQAVRKPALRSQFDGLRLPGSDDPFELGELLDANMFTMELGQSIVSAYKHGMSLVTVGAGESGETPVQIVGHSAETSAAIWDRRSRRLRSALTISGTDDQKKPTSFSVYLTDCVIECEQGSGGGWSARILPQKVDRVMAVPVLSDPQLTRPLGRSRLTNSVMALNDIAVRTLARMEANAEFYSSPQVALLGVDYESFYGDNAMADDEKFQLAMDRLLAVTKDEEGDTPKIQQLQQASMQPHSDMMRTVAMAFSGETSLPPSSLGVVHDQPASAEAIRAAEHDLLIDVTYHNRYVHPTAVKQIAELAVMVRDNLSTPPDEMWKLSVQFADPEFRSLSAESDSVMKLAVAMPDLIENPVLLERIFTAEEAERIRDDARRASGRRTLENMVAAARERDNPVERSPVVDDPVADDGEPDAVTQ